MLRRGFRGTSPATGSSVSFEDRRSAGETLGRRVATLKPIDPLVLALPRGGVPVGFEVAKALRCDLDVLVVRKVGVPHHSELAMGAVAEGGVVVRNEDVIRLAGVSTASFDSVVKSEREELSRRLRAYRGESKALDVRGRTVVLVDDGLATGSTALAAIAALRQMGAESIWVAVPVAPRDTTHKVEKLADRLVILELPAHFGAVGAWYRDFTQTSDEQVRSLLDEARLP